VSNSKTHKITVLRLPTGYKMREFGGPGTGPGQFSGPYNLCFLPNGNLLVAEFMSKRLQEVTLTGDSVRIIGADTIQSFIGGLTTNGELIAVGKVDEGTNGRVLLYSVASGDLVRQFGDCGSEPGKLGSCWGVCFTPDNRHIIVAESHPNNRLSVFTVEGAFVKCIGAGVLNWPTSVGLTATGDLVVSDQGHHRICVFSFSSGEPLRHWGTEGSLDGQFKFPKVAQVAAGRLYVLERDSPRVQAFE